MGDVEHVGVGAADGSSVVSDSDISAFLRQKTGTSYHASSTCRMGVDPDAIVDTDGRVDTVQQMRIVDASIMPKVITGNLNAPVMMMAEKLADRIRGRQPLAPSDAASTANPDPTALSQRATVTVRPEAVLTRTRRTELMGN